MPITFLAFDLLHQDGHDLTGRPYEERREALEALGLEGSRWGVAPTVPGTGRDALQVAHGLGLNGVIAKRRKSPYTPGTRSKDWILAELIPRSRACRARGPHLIAGYRVSRETRDDLFHVKRDRRSRSRASPRLTRDSRKYTSARPDTSSVSAIAAATHGYCQASSVTPTTAPSSARLVPDVGDRLR